MKTSSVIGLQIRYERSFLVDLKRLKPAAQKRLRWLVTNPVESIAQLQQFAEFRQLPGNSIFYRFTVDDYLIGLEITGEIVKFLRVLPKPGTEAYPYQPST